MDNQLLRVFQREIERQCCFALIAFEDLNSSLDDGNLDRLWYSVQGFLIAAGNISKLLWPPNSSLAVRGQRLRQVLAVSDQPALRARTYRNHFEHFDERLQEWATSSARRNFVDSNVGPPNTIVGLESTDFLRNFDTQSFTITFRGDVYELQPISKEISELCTKARAEVSKPRRGPVM